VRLSDLRAGLTLPPGRFLVLISVRGWVDLRAIARLEGLRQLKNPMTLSEIEPACIFRRPFLNFANFPGIYIHCYVFKSVVLVARLIAFPSIAYHRKKLSFLSRLLNFHVSHKRSKWTLYISVGVFTLYYKTCEVMFEFQLTFVSSFEYNNFILGGQIWWNRVF
jgi:hypothetical protein